MHASVCCELQRKYTSIYLQRFTVYVNCLMAIPVSEFSGSFCEIPNETGTTAVLTQSTPGTSMVPAQPNVPRPTSAQMPKSIDDQSTSIGRIALYTIGAVVAVFVMVIITAVIIVLARRRQRRTQDVNKQNNVNVYTIQGPSDDVSQSNTDDYTALSSAEYMEFTDVTPTP